MQTTPARRRKSTHFLEVLEARIAPATLISYSNTTHTLTVQGDYVDDGSSVVQAGAAENLSFGVAGGNLLITDASHHVTDAGAGTQVAANQVSVPLTALTGDIVIDTGTGADSLTFNNTLALAANHAFSATTTGTIALAAGAHYSVGGTGALAWSTTRDISLATGSSLSVADGNLHLTATGTVSGAYPGINLGGSVTSTGLGGLFFTGTGGNTGTGNHGIFFSGSLNSSGSGQVSLTGTGGAGTDNNDGLSLLSGTIAGSTSEISLFGEGGGDAGATVGIDLGITLSGASSNLIELHTDAGLQFEAGASIDAGTHPVLLAPLTAGTAIDLGTFQRTSFGVSSSMLLAISAGAIQVGTGLSGPITVSAAVGSSHSLELHSANGISGSGAITVTGNHDLVTASGGAVNLTGAIVVTGLATFQGQGATVDVTLTNSGNDFAGVNLVSTHNVSLRDDNGFNLSADVSGLLTLNSAGTINLNGMLDGGGDLLKSGAGTFQIAPTAIINSFFNNVTVSAGTVIFTGGLATGTVTLGDSNTFAPVALLASVAEVANPIPTNIVVPSLSGSPAVTIGTTAFTSAVDVEFTGTLMLGRPTTLQGGDTGGTTFDGAISGNVGMLTISGGHTVTLFGSTNSFVGDVKVTAASTLKLNSGANEIPDASSVDLAVNTFLVLEKDNNSPESISGLTGTGTVTTTSLMGAPSQGLIIGTNNGGFQFNGTITQNAAQLSLTKAGTGVGELTGSETYRGSTTVTGGFLELDSTTSNNPLPNSGTIDIRAGATLDVSNLNGAAGSGTLALGALQTLRGAGAISGNLAGAGTVLPGESGAVGILTINGTFHPAGHLSFRVNSPYATAGTDYDQIIVSGAVDLSAGSIALTGGATLPGPAASLQVISSTSAAATVAGHSPAEGGILFAGQSAFAVSYVGGDNNDVVLTTAVAQTNFAPALNKGTLTIASSSGRSSQMSIFVSLGDLIVTSALDTFSAAPAGGTLLNNNHGISIPVTKITKGVVINGGGGDDILTLDLSTGSKLPTGGVTFNGGAQSSTAGDQLVITGGTQGDVTYTFASAHDGSVAMSKLGKINYTGLEPVKNTGDADNVTFNLPAGASPNNAFLSDDGIAFNGLTRLRGSTFEQTDFQATGTLTINRGNSSDALSVGNMLDLAAADVELGTPAKPFGNIAFTDSFFNESDLSLATVNLQVPVGASLAPAGHGTLTVGGGVIDGTIDGDLGITKFGINDLFLNGANTFTGDTNLPSGPVDLGNALALQNSTVHIGSSFALQFGGGIGTFTLGGLAGSGALPLTDANSAAVILKVGANDSTYSGVLSGAGTLDKVGDGTLNLTGHNTHAATLIEKGTLGISSDQALGKAGTTVTFKGLTDGGTLHATANVTTARPIFLQSGPATFEASAGKTLTLSGVISGSGDFLVGPTGNVVVTGQANTNTGSVAIGSGTSQMVNGVTITAPGSHGGVIVTPGATPNTVASIDLTNASTPISITVKTPKTGTVTVNKIVSNDTTPIKAITLGTNVLLGDGVADSTPDVEIDGKLTTLTTFDVNPNTIIALGKGLAYLDTYKNKPNVTFHDVLGPGVTVDVTGDGMTPAGMGGGGLGKLTVNKWGSPGLIKTTQGITSFTVKTGDSFASLQVDPNHLGAATVGNVGSISIPTGQWAGTGMEVEGIVAKFLTKGLAQGSTLSAGAFGTVSVKGNYGGKIIATFDPTVGPVVRGKTVVTATGVVGNVTIAGDFNGSINGDGKVGNITLSGTARFQGSVRGASIGNISAASFTGLANDALRHTITAIRSIGNITAKTGGLTDYLIAAGTELGHDGLLDGVNDSYATFFLTGTKKTAVSVGSVTIKGAVSGTTIAAGVNPGTGGIYGDGNDTIEGVTGFTGKTKIGALSFNTAALPTVGFTAAPGFAVTNAFEAQTVTSVKIGTGKNDATVMRLVKTFTNPTYLDTGSATIIVRVLTAFA